MKFAKTIIILVLFLAYIPITLAHTPLKPDTENTSLESAFEIPNPTKSWTLYRELHEDYEAEYFKLHFEPDERFRISLYVPRGEDFLPNLIVMGPGITSEDELPDFLEIQNDMSFDIIESERPEKPEYEPFTPASYYYVADFDIVISDHGTYYFAVYGSGHGKYGVAVGSTEEFTLIEWIRIPLDVVKIRLWEGQSPLKVFSPMVLTLAVGYYLLYSKSKHFRTPKHIVGTFSSFLYIGSGLMFLMQIFINLLGSDSTNLVFVSFVFASLPLIIGYLLLLKSLRDGSEASMRERLVFVLIGLLGLITWSGFLIGPILAMLTSILPNS